MPSDLQPRSQSLRLTGHNPALDGVRGLAILLVVAYHFFPLHLPGSPGIITRTWSAVAGFGGSGVDLFFVLSGFLITGILLSEKRGDGYFRNFYARRALRIFPLYYGVLYAALVVWPRISHFSAAEMAVVHRQGWLWTYTGNILAGRSQQWPFTGGRISLDPVWSLCIEEQFYLLWPLAAYLLSRRSLAICCFAMILIAPALRWYLYAHNDPTLAFYVWAPCRMDGLAMGALLALDAERDGGKAARRLAFPALILAVLSVVLTWNFPSRGEVYATTQMMVVSAALIVLAVGGAPASLYSRAFAATPLRFLGKYSYAIYLFHPFVLKNVSNKLVGLGPMQHVVSRSPLALVATPFILGLGLSAAAAYMSWHLFEKHFLKLKRYFEYQRPADLSTSQGETSALPAVTGQPLKAST